MDTTLDPDIGYKITFLHEQLTSAGLNILGVDIDKVIQWATPPTAQDLQTAQTILQSVDFATLKDIDKEQLRSEYQNTLTQLQAIENATNPTNAQVISAVKYLARTVRLLLKLLARLILARLI